MAEIGRSHSTGVEDVNIEESILNNRIQDIPGNGVRRVITFDLCAVARGSAKSVRTVDGEVGEREEKTNST